MCWKPSSWRRRNSLTFRCFWQQPSFQGCSYNTITPSLCWLREVARSGFVPAGVRQSGRALEQAEDAAPQLNLDIFAYLNQVHEPNLLTVLSSLSFLVLCVFPCLSRIPVQRPGAWGGGGPWPGSAAAAPRAGGCQLLLPASLWPAHVHHAHTVQQENDHQRQGQGNGGGQGRLPVSLFNIFSAILLCLQVF